MRIATVGLIFVGLVSVSAFAAAIDEKPGMDLCVACHGKKGQGNEAIKAPGIANLKAWYVNRQLQNYRKGLRGAHAADAQGTLMRSVVESLSDTSLMAYAEASAAYPDYIPDSEEPAGDAKLGKSLYAHQCGACHGRAGKGIKSLGAPSIAGLEGWYIRKQIANFKQGIRGGVAGDIYGGQMVFYLSRLKSLDDLGDIIAYLRDPVAVE